MTRSVDPDDEIWGTREELLLAGAVSRHGAENWDSVAMEVQKRSPVASLVTARSCEKRFCILQQRFTTKSGIDAEESQGGAESDTISLLEQLRKVRVAELRREVERSDVSILSLQLKVKGLKEDRERTISEEQSGSRTSDPPDAEGKEKGADESRRRSTEDAAADCCSNGDVGRSCNESNSSGRKLAQDSDAATDDAHPTGERSRAESSDPAAADRVTGEEEKLAGEGSYNGSSDTVAKCTEATTTPDEPAGTNPARRTHAGDSGESMAESKGEDTSKEGSDVQSSASPSRRGFRRRKAAASGVSSGGDDAEADEVSPPSEKIAARSEPWASFLEIFRSAQLGSTFERRLQAQVPSNSRIRR